jgi:hypothetical protein
VRRAAEGLCGRRARGAQTFVIDSRQLKLITRAAWLEGLRWAREHLYVLLVLGPLVLGMTYFGVGRMVSGAEWSLSSQQAIALAVLVAGYLLVSSMSRAAAELYHTRRPESLFDTLPIGAETLLAAALVRRIVGSVGVAAVAAVARGLLGGGPWDLVSLPAIALLVLVLSLGELFAALEWVHWGSRRKVSKAAAGVALGGACALVAGLLLLAVVRPDRLTEGSRLIALVAGLTMTFALAPLVFALHGRWRVGDLEHAKRLHARDRWGGWAERVARRASGGKPIPAVSAQLARDLRLTLRGFSSAVYAVGTVAALWLVALLAVLETVEFPAPLAAAQSWAGATWLPAVLATKAACVLACVSLVCLVPVLVAHQVPHLWLERVTGAHASEVWRAKLYYARVLALPAALATWAVGVFGGAVPVFYTIPLLAEHLWLWWIVSTLAGGLAYEMPDQPGLSVVLVACACLAAGGFTAFVWPMGLALYAFGLPQLLLRGQHRTHLHLVGEGG